jgi:hypothetical protein
LFVDNSHLAISALVNELADRLEVGVAVCNEGLDDAEHLDRGLGQTNEDTIVDLEKTEKLKCLALLGVDLVDTLDTDDKGELSLIRDIKLSLFLGDTSKADLLALCVAVFLDVLFGALEDDFTLLLVGLRLLVSLNASQMFSFLQGRLLKRQTRKMVDCATALAEA